MIYNIKNLLKQRQRENGYRLLIKSLRIRHGDRIALTGPSGCGKSTALDILGLSLEPDCAGEFVFFANEPLPIMGFWQKRQLDKLADLRRKYLGYVLQSGELLPFLTTGENICFMGNLAGNPEAETLNNGKELAERLGIEKLWNAMPASLSVGERQRAAIARALAAKPKIIIADEPTAALDPFHAQKVMGAFLDCLENYASALILATHNAEWARDGGLREIRFIMKGNKKGAIAIIDDGGGNKGLSDE